MARYGNILLVTLDENNELEGDALAHVKRVAEEAAATAAAPKLDATAFADYVAQARGTTTTVQNRSASLNAVTDFNADPTGSVDSTAAINRAIQQAAERGGGTVHLPAGAYKVSYPFIELLGSVHLQGAGRESTTLFVDTAVPVPVKTAVIHAGNYEEPRRGTGNILMGVSDLFIKAEHPHAAVKNGAGFYVHGGRNIFTACTAQENGGHGFAIVGTANQFIGYRSASSSWGDVSSNAPVSAADNTAKTPALSMVFLSRHGRMTLSCVAIHA